MIEDPPESPPTVDEEPDSADPTEDPTPEEPTPVRRQTFGKGGVPTPPPNPKGSNGGGGYPKGYRRFKTREQLEHEINTLYNEARVGKRVKTWKGRGKTRRQVIELVKEDPLLINALVGLLKTWHASVKQREDLQIKQQDLKLREELDAIKRELMEVTHLLVERGMIPDTGIPLGGKGPH